jgi:hypothetical protein
MTRFLILDPDRHRLPCTAPRAFFSLQIQADADLDAAVGKKYAEMNAENNAKTNGK